MHVVSGQDQITLAPEPDPTGVSGPRRPKRTKAVFVATCSEESEAVFFVRVTSSKTNFSEAVGRVRRLAKRFREIRVRDFPNRMFDDC